MGQGNMKDLAHLINENCPRSTVRMATVERMVVTCNAEDANDTEVELVRAGFSVQKRHPTLKGEMRLNMQRTIITAERVATN